MNRDLVCTAYPRGCVNVHAARPTRTEKHFDSAFCIVSYL